MSELSYFIIKWAGCSGGIANNRLTNLWIVFPPRPLQYLCVAAIGILLEVALLIVLFLGSKMVGQPNCSHIYDEIYALQYN